MNAPLPPPKPSLFVVKQASLCCSGETGWSKKPKPSQPKPKVLVVREALIWQHPTQARVQLEAASSLSAQGRRALLGVHTAGWEGLQVWDSTPELSAAVAKGPFAKDPGVWVSIVFVPLRHRPRNKTLRQTGGCWSSSSPSSSSLLTCIRGGGADGDTWFHRGWATRPSRARTTRPSRARTSRPSRAQATRPSRAQTTRPALQGTDHPASTTSGCVSSTRWYANQDPLLSQKHPREEQEGFLLTNFRP